MLELCNNTRCKDTWCEGFRKPKSIERYPDKESYVDIPCTCSRVKNIDFLVRLVPWVGKEK
jgi:hypothetical protein